MILAYAEESGFVLFSADTFWKLHRRQHNKNELQRLLDYLHNQGRLIRLNNRRYMTPHAMEIIKEKTTEIMQRKGSITLGDCKEIMGYGRTVGVPVLEYLDSIGFTRRDGGQADSRLNHAVYRLKTHLTPISWTGTTKHDNAASHSGLDPESRSSFRRRPEQGLDSGSRIGVRDRLRCYDYLFLYKGEGNSKWQDGQKAIYF